MKLAISPIHQSSLRMKFPRLSFKQAWISGHKLMAALCPTEIGFDVSKPRKDFTDARRYAWVVVPTRHAARPMVNTILHLRRMRSEERLHESIEDLVA